MATKKAAAKIGEGIYTALDASKIFNIPYSKANYWFQYYVKKKHFKTDYRYYFPIKNIIAVNFLTLIEMYVFYSLKREGATTHTIIQAHKFLSKSLNTDYPFAAKDFYVIGKKILFAEKIFLVSADKRFQAAFPEVVTTVAKKITYSDDRLAHKFYPLGQNKSVVINPENQFGQPIIDGTNILVSTIYNLFLGGDRPDFIAGLYDITERNVFDAIEFSGFPQAA